MKRYAARLVFSTMAFALGAVPVARAQLVTVPMATVPGSDAQPGGPTYDYDVSIFEVTNEQFAIFLNDAELHNETQNPGSGDERGANMLFRLPPNPGDVGLLVGDSSDVDSLFDLSRSLLLYDVLGPLGSRYSVVPGKEMHPVVGMGWLGAVKFCNWLTIDQGLGLGQRCYAEGASELDWFPVTIGSEIGGTQQTTNAVRDLTAAERAALVQGYRGFRLLMDQGGSSVGATNAVPRPFNEWFKAAAYDPAAPDVARVLFVGFPFEQHTVPPDHWAHGFGRDPLLNADANYRSSGDPFDDTKPAVIATTPVGYYDGSLQGGSFQTVANANRYGLFDMSGNVWEFLNDQVAITDSVTPDRAIAGGSYRSNQRQVTVANRGDIGPGSTRPVVGFRLARVTGGLLSYCFGSDVDCPCANGGASDTGCDIAQSTGGVRLETVSLVPDGAGGGSAVLRGVGYPTGSFPTVVGLRSASPGLAVFGDGLLCVTPPVVRFGAATAVGGVSQHTVGHGVGAGTFYYQLWFRNTPIGFCDLTAAFNTSNGLQAVWP